MALQKFKEFSRDRQRPVSRRVELNVLQEGRMTRKLRMQRRL
jgi:hypothetical protein